MPNILALDLALTAGYAIKTDVDVEVGTIKLGGKSMYGRQVQISAKITELISFYGIDTVIVETPVYVYKKSIMTTMFLHAAAYIAAKAMGCKVYHFPPSAWRTALGIPVRAGRDVLKAEAVSYTCEQLNISDIDNDAADAYCIMDAYLKKPNKANEIV